MVVAAVTVAGDVAPADIWAELSGEQIATAVPAGALSWLASPGLRYRVYLANADRLETLLAQAPKEGEASALRLPVPRADGRYEMVVVIEHLSMTPPLAAKFPHLKTYRGEYRARGITAAPGFTFKAHTFDGMLLLPTERKVLLDLVRGTTDVYVAVQSIRRDK